MASIEECQIMRFVPAVEAPAVPDQPARWFMFRDGNLLVGSGAGDPIPLCKRPEEIGVAPVRSQYMGRLDGVPCFSAELAKADSVPSGLELIGLRQLFGRVDDAVFWAAGRAVQIVAWDREHQFCGQCGSATHARCGERARECRSSFRACRRRSSS
jgi:NAD+ diphosphatase